MKIITPQIFSSNLKSKDIVQAQRSLSCVSSVIPQYFSWSRKCVSDKNKRVYQPVQSLLLLHTKKQQSQWTTIPFSTNTLRNDETNTNNNNEIHHRVIPFLLADIGEGIHEVELIKWNVQEGDKVQQFDSICQVQSDKATVDITSRFDGTVVKLAGNVGEMIQVGKPLIFLETTANTIDEESKQPSVFEMEQTTLNSLSIPPSMTNEENMKCLDMIHDDVVSTITSRTSQIKMQTSPAVRKMCKERSIDPSIIPATGPQGRLLKADVLAFLNESCQPSTMDDPNIVSNVSNQIINGDDIVELRGYTRAMAKAMTQSLEIPHMCLGDELDVTRLLTIRKEINANRTVKISLLAFLIKACSVALKEYPILNAAKDTEKSIRMQSQHQIGVAMDTVRGLVVPVIGDCSTMSISDIQERMDVLKENRDTIALDASSRPTFTLSNIGAIGAGLSLQPVLVPPQLAMGAIGRLQRLPRFDKNDDVVAVSILPITWAADHRYVDGAMLARFHMRVQELLVNPYEMMVHMI